MAPLRRYLRITKYSVLEVRVYLENPSLAQSWLVNPRDPVLPRIIQAIRPYVLPKLREERERAKGRGGKKVKSVKDVVQEDEFEVSIFLTDTATRHALVTRHKSFYDKQGKMRSNSGRLTGWLQPGTSSEPVNVEEGEPPVTILEESDDETVPRWQDLPDASEAVRIEDEISEDEGFQSQQKLQSIEADARDETKDDKKKMLMRTTYRGLSVYGKTLCLVVKRRGSKGKLSGPRADASGQQMLESWVSTQAAQEPTIEDD